METLLNSKNYSLGFATKKQNTLQFDEQTEVYLKPQGFSPTFLAVMSYTPHFEDMRIYLIIFCVAVISGNEYQEQNTEELNQPNFTRITQSDRSNFDQIPEEVKNEVLNFTRGNRSEELAEKGFHKRKIIRHKGHGSGSKHKKAHFLNSSSTPPTPAIFSTSESWLGISIQMSTANDTLEKQDQLADKFSKTTPLVTEAIPESNVSMVPAAITERSKNAGRIFQSSSVEALSPETIVSSTTVATALTPIITKISNRKTTGQATSLNQIDQVATIGTRSPLTPDLEIIKQGPITTPVQKADLLNNSKPLKHPTPVSDHSSVRTTIKVPGKNLLQKEKHHSVTKTPSTRMSSSLLTNTTPKAYTKDHESVNPLDQAAISASESDTTKKSATKAPKSSTKTKKITTKRPKHIHSTKLAPVSSSKSATSKIPEPSTVTMIPRSSTTMEKAITEKQESVHSTNTAANSSSILVTTKTPTTAAVPKLTSTTLTPIPVITKVFEPIITTSKFTKLISTTYKPVEIPIKSVTKTAGSVDPITKLSKSIITTAKLAALNPKLITTTYKPTLISTDLVTTTPDLVSFSPTTPKFSTTTSDLTTKVPELAITTKIVPTSVSLVTTTSTTTTPKIFTMAAKRIAELTRTASTPKLTTRAPNTERLKLTTTTESASPITTTVKSLLATELKSEPTTKITTLKPELITIITPARTQKIVTEPQLRTIPAEPIETTTMVIFSPEYPETLKIATTKKSFEKDINKLSLSYNPEIKTTTTTPLLSNSDPASNTIIPDIKPQVKSIRKTKKKTKKKKNGNDSNPDFQANFGSEPTLKQTTTMAATSTTSTTMATTFTTKRRKKPNRRRKGHPYNDNIDLDKMWG